VNAQGLLSLGLVKHGVVFATAGRRSDADDTIISRFPLVSVEQTLHRIREALMQWGATAVVSSAACGADLLALSAAADLHLMRRVVLPFEPERFRETSVLDRPGNWAAIFDETLRELQPRGEVVVLEEMAGDTEAAFLAVGETVLAEAAKIARNNGGRPAAMVIWDGRPRPGVDLTAHFRDSAVRLGFEIVEVLTVG
jgi:hypothetical protein